jgi:hypothetical protein
MCAVPEHYAFTDNVRDLSNSNGYQFEFVCERCGNGHRSPFVRDKVDLGRNILRGVGDLIGGSGYRLNQVANAMDWNRGTNSAAKDRAMTEAVETVRDEFRQCRGCGDWVCHNVCWNLEIGQCLRCSPAVEEEMSRAQAAAQVQQIRERAETADWTSHLDISTRTTVTCPGCRAKVAGGKFCSSCGSSLVTATVSCRSCGYERNTPGSAFCAECGSSMT